MWVIHFSRCNGSDRETNSGVCVADCKVIAVYNDPIMGRNIAHRRAKLRPSKEDATTVNERVIADGLVS